MILHGDCLDKLKTFPTNYFDAVVTDPPYGLSFMGKKWDYDVPSVAIWQEVLRVLKPGGHLLSFGGTRTYHRMVVNIEDAGFEIRDQLQWIYSQGFPKSLNVAKEAIKKGHACGCEAESKHDVRPMPDSDLSEALDHEDQRGEVLQSFVSEQGLSESGTKGCPVIRGSESVLAGRKLHRAGKGLSDGEKSEPSKGSTKRLCAGAHFSSREDDGSSAESGRGSPPHQSQSVGQSTGESESVRESHGTLDGPPFPRCPKCSRPILQEGLGTSLKPANEPICLARKPLEKGLTIAENVLKYGTGGINIDGSRIGFSENESDSRVGTDAKWNGRREASKHTVYMPAGENIRMYKSEGRFPSNVLLDEEAAKALDEQSGSLRARGNKTARKHVGDYDASSYKFGNIETGFAGDSGGASRFFYVAKASKSERNAGLEGMEDKDLARSNAAKAGNEHEGSGFNRISKVKNHHPTVKPLKLMQYLITQITPPGGIVLDPFAGSGTTLVAAKKLGFGYVGIEREREYCEITEKRLEAV